MATVFYTNNTRTVPSAYPQLAYYDMKASAIGSPGTSLSDTAQAAPDERPIIEGANNEPLVGWSLRVVDQVTIAGDITFTVRSTTMGAGFTGRFRARVYKVTAGGSNVETLIATGDATSDIVASATYTFTATPPAAVVVSPGERFLLRISVLPVAGSFGTDGTTVTISYGSSTTVALAVSFTETIVTKANGAKLYLRRTSDNGISTFFDLIETRGVSAVTTGVVNTQASGTEIQWTRTAGGTVLEWISGRLKAPGWTAALGTSIGGDVWALESNASANCHLRTKCFRRRPDGAELLVWTKDSTTGELPTPASQKHVLSVTPLATLAQATNFAEDDRLVCRVYIIPNGTMGGGFTCTVEYDSSVASGNSFIQLLDSPEFKSEGDPLGASRIEGGLTMGGVGN